MSSTGTRSILIEAARQSGPVALPIFGIAGTVATFVVWGLVPSLVALCVLLLLALFAVARVRTRPGTVESTTTPEDRSSEASDAEPEAAELEVEGARAQGGGGAGKPTEGDDLVVQAVARAFAGDINGVAQLMERHLEAVDDADQEWAEALREQLLVKAGDSGAIPRLRALAEAAERADVVAAYGSTLGWMGNPRGGAEYILGRLAGLPGKDRAKLELDAAELLSQAGDSLSATYHAESVAADQDVAAEDRARALSILAGLCDKSDAVRAMYFYEASLMLDPSRSSDRFNLAYMYGEHNLHAAAAHHYRLMVHNNQATAMAHNNLGVDYRLLGLPLMGSREYEKSVEMGAALAAANLAHLALDSGDGLRAESLIERGADQDNSEPRLIAASERLAAAKKEERKKAVELEHAGVLVGGAISSGSPRRPDAGDLAGSWLDDANDEVEIVEAQHGGGWTVDLGSGYSARLQQTDLTLSAEVSHERDRYRGVAFVSQESLVIVAEESGAPNARVFSLRRPDGDTG